VSEELYARIQAILLNDKEMNICEVTGAHQRIRLVHPGRHWLLADHVEAVLRRHDSMTGMQPTRRADRDGVSFRLRKHGLVAREGGNAQAVAGRASTISDLVADRNNSQSRRGTNGFDMTLANTAAANNPDTEFTDSSDVTGHYFPHLVRQK
jgi:hypothetical protein